MKIGIDTDGVLFNIAGQFSAAIKDVYGFETDNSLPYYKMEHYLGVTKEECDAFFKRWCGEFEASAIKGAKEGVEHLQRKGHDLVVITKRWERAKTNAWLFEQGWGDIPTVYLKDGDSMIDVDLMLDDSPEKLAQLMPHIKVQAFLLMQLNNTFCLDVMRRFKKVNSWNTFTYEVDKLNGDLKTYG